MKETHATYVFELLLSELEKRKIEHIKNVADLAAAEAANAVIEANDDEDFRMFNPPGHRDTKYVHERTVISEARLNKISSSVNWYAKKFMENPNDR